MQERNSLHMQCCCNIAEYLRNNVTKLHLLCKVAAALCADCVLISPSYTELYNRVVD